MLAPSRRDFLRLMGASVALAGMTACRRWPSETIVPMAHRPEGYVPGSTLQYATSFELGGAATGLLVTSYDGRPIKVEGNPLHPQSLGATDPLAQATVLQLYDPDRSTDFVLREGGNAVARDKDAFAAWAGPLFGVPQTSGGQGLRVLAEPSSSPTMADMKARFAAVFPQATWVEWDPLSRDAAREGARLVFGRPMRSHLALENAQVIAAFDADILFDDPGGARERTRLGREAARRRRLDEPPLRDRVGLLVDGRLRRSPHRRDADPRAGRPRPAGSAPSRRGRDASFPKTRISRPRSGASPRMPSMILASRSWRRI
jgi:molybdopterin-containing oxidoreductase family iron-sulfur binding subunit